jgi:hypothetical protein
MPSSPRRDAPRLWRTSAGAGIGLGQTTVGAIVSIVGIAVLWGLAGIALVALGRYDDMPHWFQVGSGGSLFLLYGLWSWGRGQRSE